MPRTTNNYTEQMWKVIKEFALQQNRLNAEKNYAQNEIRSLEDEAKRGYKTKVAEFNKKWDKATFGMNLIDKSIDFVSRQMGFLPVDVYNEMERHWQEDLKSEQQRGYSTF